jgi:hypothetical protein
MGEGLEGPDFKKNALGEWPFKLVTQGGGGT